MREPNFIQSSFRFQSVSSQNVVSVDCSRVGVAAL